MDSIEYLRRQAALEGCNVSDENNFCPITIKKALEIAEEVNNLRAENEALKERLAYFEAITTGAEHAAIDAALRGEENNT